MDTYTVPVTFPDLDTAKRDAGSLVDALRTAGVHAELAGGPDASHDDAGRPDPGPTTRELRVRAGSADEARRRVQQVADGQFPPGVVLLGEPR
jgi:hypothetical protein